MPKKPTNLIYGVDEKPPVWLTLFMGFQHIGIAKKVRLELVPGTDFPQKIYSFMEENGGAWGHGLRSFTKRLLW